MSITDEIIVAADAAYAGVRKELGCESDFELSTSELCSYLSRTMYQECVKAGIFCRREVHRYTGTDLWHVLLAHSATPTDDEIITDLCPWQFTPTTKYRGLYHGTRQKLIELLLSEGAKPRAAQLFSAETILIPHTLEGTKLADYVQLAHRQETTS